MLEDALLFIGGVGGAFLLMAIVGLVYEQFRQD